MSEEKENRDYDHKTSVRGFTSGQNLSSKENPKPTSGQEPFPIWLMVVCVLLMIVGGISVGANSGGFKFSNSHKLGYDPATPPGLTGKAPELSEFEKYVNYYIGNKSDKDRVYEKVSDRWEVAVSLSEDDKLEHVSFVNGIYTFKGGKHVDNVSNHIAKKLQTYASTKGIKRKKCDVKINHIKDNMWIFLKSVVVNPSFDSQTKECLTTVASKFGSKCEVSDKFIEQLAKIGIIEKAMKLGEFKDNSNVSKTDGKKKSTIRVPKLDDANWAGTSKSNQCTLILTEGDSAKAFAIAGLSVIGRDKYGVFPLRGKMLNVRDCVLKKAAENAEINNIKKILGLQQFNTGTNKQKEYNDTKELRYGSIMILTDQDVDGSHIKGLFINFINTY